LSSDRRSEWLNKVFKIYFLLRNRRTSRKIHVALSRAYSLKEEELLNQVRGLENRWRRHRNPNRGGEMAQGEITDRAGD
jgi:hypothetical protein